MTKQRINMRFFLKTFFIAITLSKMFTLNSFAYNNSTKSTILKLTEEKINKDYKEEKKDFWPYYYAKGRTDQIREVAGFICTERVNLKCQKIVNFGYEFTKEENEEIWTLSENYYDRPVSYNQAVEGYKAIIKKSFDYGTRNTIFDNPYFNFTNNLSVVGLLALGWISIPVDIVTTPFQLMFYGGDAALGALAVRRFGNKLKDYIENAKVDGLIHFRKGIFEFTTNSPAVENY